MAAMLVHAILSHKDNEQLYLSLGLYVYYVSSQMLSS